ncbi:MAG: hypothetical protein AAB788_00620 [Patescibacteria group bacterium]
MTEARQLWKNYRDSMNLIGLERNHLWIATNKEKVGGQVNDAITLLEIDDSFDNLSKNPTNSALTQAFADCIFSSFGPSLTSKAKTHLQILRGGEEIKFTSNHDTSPGLLFPLNEEGIRLSGAIPKNMLTLDSETGDLLSLGDISPIKLDLVDKTLVAEMMTPGKNVWKWEFVPTIAKPYYKEPVDENFNVGQIEIFCASENSAIIILARDCAENCLFCGVPRGNGKMTYEDKLRRKIVFEKMFKNIPDKSGGFFGATLSGGSSKALDGGFSHNFGWALKELDNQLSVANKNRINPIKMRLQLEIILPKDKTSWQGIIDTIEIYVKKGWDISLAMNQEVVQNEIESMFLQGVNKKETTTDDLVKFANQLKDKVGDKVLVNSLILFGLKPIEMSDEEYLITQLDGIKKLFNAGIRVDINPVKNNMRKNKQDPVRLEAFPAVNPALLFLQSIAVAKLNQNFDKTKFRHGCVGGCSLCNPRNTIERFVRIAEKAYSEGKGPPIPEILKHLLDTTGQYQQQFEALFQN